MRFLKETKTVTKNVMVQQEVEITSYNWDSIPNGTYVECEINGISIKGVFSKVDDYGYILHNDERKRGSEPEQTYGYKFGWAFNIVDYENGNTEISNLIFPEPPADFVLRETIKPSSIEVGDYNSLIYKNVIKVGCQVITKEKVEEVLRLMNESEAEF